MNNWLEYSPELPERKSFVGTQQIAWDSTSLGTLQECPRKYYYNIICGIIPLGEAVHLKFGLIYHAALEEYDRSITKGNTHEDSILVAVRYALTQTWEKRLNRPWISSHDIKNRFSLVRSIVDYLDKFDEEGEMYPPIILPSGEPAVELSFNYEINYQTPFSTPYKLCGHIDKLCVEKDQLREKVSKPRLYIADKKTTLMPLNDQYWNQYATNTQIDFYYFSSQIIFEQRISGFFIDAIRITKDASELERRTIPRTPTQLDEWYKELAYWLSTAETYSKNNYWPRNPKSCVKGFTTCEYIEICKTCPSTRPSIVRSGWGRRIWDPIEIREAS